LPPATPFWNKYRNILITFADLPPTFVSAAGLQQIFAPGRKSSLGSVFVASLSSHLRKRDSGNP